MDELKIKRRNILSMIPEGALIFTAFTFLDASSVISVFIDNLTGSIQLAGAAIALRWICFYIPQFFMGPYVNKTKNLPRLITIIALTLRPLPIVMIPVLFCGFTPFTTVFILFIVFGAFFAGEGAINIPWWDVFGRTIPSETRGKVLGYQQVLGGILSLASGFVIKFVLDSNSMSFTAKYSIIFGLGGFIALLSALMMPILRDLPRDIQTEAVSLISSLKKFPSYLKNDKAFVNLNIVQLIAGISAAVIPLSILFCKNNFGLNNNHVSTLVYLQIAGTLAGGVTWGALSHRLGNKSVIIASQILGLLLHITALTCILLGKSTPFILLALIVFMAGMYTGNWLGFSNYILDIAKDRLRPTYVIIYNIFSFPTTLLYYFAGLVAGGAGFVPLYIVGAAAALSALVLSYRLKSQREIEEMNRT
jgi:Major Facilitator Superfamily.